MAIQTDHKDIINLIMGDLTQFHIPIYQRTYTWEADKQVEKLLDDVIEFGREYKDNKRAEYYIGNVIVKNQTRGMITERVVIDGQQRITTTILMLCAIRDIYLQKYISDEGQQIASNIHRSLYSKEGTEVKLKLNNMENQRSLTLLLSSRVEELSQWEKQIRYIINYNYIYKRFSRMSEDAFISFLDLLRRVKVVIIFLDEDQDENSVFESINSTGKPLAGSDLIKNFLFTFKNYECSHKKEDDLINLYISKFESLFKDEENFEEELESFYRAYIAIKTQWRLISKNDPKKIYYSFKKYIGDITSIEMCSDIILDLSKWAVIYQMLRVRGHKDINSNYLGFLKSSFGTYLILLMQIIDNYSHVESGEVIIDDRDEVNSAFKAIVAYEAARFMANDSQTLLLRLMPTVFVRLTRSINYDKYDRFSEKFIAFVTETKEGYRQPSIELLEKCVVTNGLYQRKRKQIKQLLILLENIDKKELLNYEKDLSDAQVEHIIPQTLSPGKWTYITADDHEKYLHTLGNLTLTFDNQKLSNYGFSQKKRILIDKSRIKLNQKLVEYDTFDVLEIEDRAQYLLELFIKEYLSNSVVRDKSY